MNKDFTDITKLHVCKQKCNQCLFSKNRIVSKERMVEILKDCEKYDDHFLCHKFSELSSESRVICRGFYERKTSKAIRFQNENKELIEKVEH